MDETPNFLRLRDPLALDDGTVDRLLDGMPVGDAPPSYRGVAALLTALRAGPTWAELDGEREAVAAMSALQVAAAPPPRQGSSVHGKRRLQLTGIALVGTATLFLGLGSAGALPGAAQAVASDVLSTIGVSAPNPDSHTGSHPGEPGVTDSGKGGTIAGIATNDSTTGIDKGAAVSSEASDGKSQAGQHGDPASATTPTAPLATPNPDDKSNTGAGTGDDGGAGPKADGDTNTDNGSVKKP
jgi:hypothetical protein